MVTDGAGKACGKIARWVVGAGIILGGLGLAAYGVWWQTAGAVAPQDTEVRLRHSQKLLQSGVGFGAIYLLNDELIQTELKLSEPVRQHLRSLAVEYAEGRKKQAAAVTESEPETGDDGEAAEDRRRRRLRRWTRQYCDQAEAKLTDEQIIRLAEIDLQLRGERLFFHPDFLQLFEIQPDRFGEFAELQNHLDAQWRTLVQQYNARQIAKDVFQGMADEHQEKLRTRVRSLLTDEELARFNSWQGRKAPFGLRDVRLTIQTNVRRTGSRIAGATPRSPGAQRASIE